MLIANYRLVPTMKRGGKAMKSFAIAAIGLAVMAWNAPSERGDSTTSPGKNAVYVSQSGVPVGTAFAPLISGTIQKGKKKRVVEVDLTLIDTGNSAGAIGVGPKINGLALVMEPTATHLQLSDCPGTSINRCTATGLFWLDLD